MKTKIFLSLVISCLLLVSTDAYAKLLVWTNGFEGLQANDWWFAGHANIDVNAGLARTGQNNGWAHNWQGWNAVNTWASTLPNGQCEVSAWLRTSGNLTNGYMSIRSASAGLPILAEIPFSGVGFPSYAQYSFGFIADGNTVLFYVGMYGNGENAWVQIDDVMVTCWSP